MDTRTTKDTDRLRGVALLAALVAGILVSSVLAEIGETWAPTPAEAVAPPQPVATESAAGCPPDVDMILDVIHEHGQGRTDGRGHRLAEAIYREATGAGIDPLLIVSIVAKESSFRSHAVSPAGAVGLMQLRPFVAQDLAARHDLVWDGGEMLREPAINVRLGVSYFKQLLGQFEGDPHMALTAYNFGPTRVSLALREGTYTGSRYARDVLDLYEHLAALRSRLATARVTIPTSTGPV